MESNASGRLQAHNANPRSLNTGRPLIGNAAMRATTSCIRAASLSAAADQTAGFPRSRPFPHRGLFPQPCRRTDCIGPAWSRPHDESFRPGTQRSDKSSIPVIAAFPGPDFETVDCAEAGACDVLEMACVQYRLEQSLAWSERTYGADILQ